MLNDLAFRLDEQRDKRMNISVIIPTYNRENFIKKCLESVLEQTYQPMEIIIVDDGSTDRTLDKVREINSSIIKIVALEKNCGAQAARNRGIKEAKGDWIAFLDSDDLWLRDKLEKQKKCVEQSGRLVCMGGGYVLQDGEMSERWLNGKSGMIFEEIILYEMCLLYPTLFVKKECLLQIGILDEKAPSYQELDTSIRLAQRYEIDYINEPLFIWNCHNESTISGNKKRRVEGKEYIFNKYKNIIKDVAGNHGMCRWYNLLAYNCPLFGKRWWKYKFMFALYKIMQFVK